MCRKQGSEVKRRGSRGANQAQGRSLALDKRPNRHSTPRELAQDHRDLLSQRHAFGVEVSDREEDFLRAAAPRSSRPLARVSSGRRAGPVGAAAGRVASSWRGRPPACLGGGGLVWRKVWARPALGRPSGRLDGAGRRWPGEPAASGIPRRPRPGRRIHLRRVFLFRSFARPWREALSVSFRSTPPAPRS